MGLEFWMAGAGHGRSMPVATLLGLAVLRGTAQGLAAGLTFDGRFGAAFGLLNVAGLSAAYVLGFSPSQEFQPDARPPLTRHKLLATSLRGLAIGVTGAVAGALTHEGARGLVFGLEVGLVVAAVGAIVAAVSPHIEWWADALPAQRLGLAGALLVLLGFALQSLRYWATLLDVPVR